MFRSVEFQHALWATFKLALITVPLGLALGVGLAVLANKPLRRIGAFRTIFSSTVATSVVVASLIWLFLLQPEVGVLANIGWLNDLFPTLKDPGLLRDPDTALWSVAKSSVWASLGFTFILVTAGLHSAMRPGISCSASLSFFASEIGERQVFHLVRIAAGGLRRGEGV